MKTTTVNRRGFLFGAATLALAGRPAKTLGADATVPLPTGRPDLRFGAISDVHLRENADSLMLALTYFRDHGVDAVIVAGDIADLGKAAELELFGACWRKAFPGGRAPDGRPVELLPVTGNHDWFWAKDKNRGPDPFDVMWEKALGVKFAPVWMKTVKGYAFIGAQYQHQNEAPAFLKAHAPGLDPKKPFFYIQHRHPKDTCIGPWAWGHDDGAPGAVLSQFPNAVAFSGHSHYSLTDERSVWQGAFTSVNTASLHSRSCDYALRENAEGNSYGYKGETRRHFMDPARYYGFRQGELVSVFGSTLVIERVNFTKGKKLGDDWILAVPGLPGMSFAARAAKRQAPAFAADAKVSVARQTRKLRDLEFDALAVTFPAARPVDACRVFEYEVTATVVEDGADLVRAQRRVLAPDLHLPPDEAGLGGTCLFSCEELAWPGHYVFTVRPIECFGKKGAAIASEPFELKFQKKGK